MVTHYFRVSPDTIVGISEKKESESKQILVELDQIIKYLRKNPKLNIEIIEETNSPELNRYKTQNQSEFSWIDVYKRIEEEKKEDSKLETHPTLRLVSSKLYGNCNKDICKVELEFQTSKGLERFLTLQRIPIDDFKFPFLYEINSSRENSQIIEESIRNYKNGIKWNNRAQNQTFENSLTEYSPLEGRLF